METNSCLLEATYLPTLWYWLQEPDTDDTRPRSVARFSMELNELSRQKSRFVDFSVVYHPLSENQTTDSLAKVSKEYHMDFIILVVIFQFNFLHHLKFEYRWTDVKKIQNHHSQNKDSCISSFYFFEDHEIGDHNYSLTILEEK